MQRATNKYKATWTETEVYSVYIYADSPSHAAQLWHMSEYSNDSLESYELGADEDSLEIEEAMNAEGEVS